MNPTLRRILVAGLGALAVTEKAARRLIDDLVAKGDITRKEGERMLTHLERKWKEESGRLAHTGGKARKGLEQLIDGALAKALDRTGLARRSEVDELRRKVEKLEGKKVRAAGASRSGTAGARTRKTPRSGKTGPA
jgi:poly(hydroxyalkanoate) granule-associated protein